MMNAAWMLIILLGIAGIFAIIMRRRIEFVFTLAIFAVIAVLYGFALAGVPVVGYQAVRAAGVCAFVACVIWLLVKCEYGRLVFTPGMAAFVLIVIAAWWGHRGQVYLYQDEFSHWGRACSQLYRLQKLPNTERGVLVFPAYPPGSTLFYTFWSWLGGAFSEGSTITASNVLMASCMLPLMQWTDWKHWKRILPMLLICVMIPLAFNARAYQDVYVDILLGCIASYALMVWFTSKQDASAVVMISGSLLVLPLIKSAGNAIALLVLAIIAIDLAGRKQTGMCGQLIDQGAEKPSTFSNPNRALLQLKRWTKVLIPAACLAVSSLSWKAFCSIHQLTGDKSFRFEDIYENIQKTLKGTISWEYEYLFQNFFRFLTNPSMMGEGNILQLSCVEWLLVFAAIACWLKRRYSGQNGLAESSGGAAGIVWKLVAGAAIYAVSLFHLYLYVFAAWEAAGLHSFDRYMSTIMIVVLAVTIALILDIWHRHPPKMLPASLAVLICMTSVVNPSHLVDLTFAAPMYTESTRTLRASMCPPGYIMEYLQPDDRVLWMASEVEDENDWLPYILNSYEFSPISITYPFGLIVDETTTPEAAEERMLHGEWGYVYCYNVNEAFIQRYASLFAEPENITGRTLYKVVKNGQDVKLHRLY